MLNRLHWLAIPAQSGMWGGGGVGVGGSWPRCRVSPYLPKGEVVGGRHLHQELEAVNGRRDCAAYRPRQPPRQQQLDRAL